MNRHGFIGAVLSSILLAAPLTAILFLGWQWFGFPFVPFDLFDALSRLLPGSVITKSIDGMIGFIRLFHLGATATAAKVVEQGIAVAVFFVLAVLSGALFLILFRSSRIRYGAGIVLGSAATILLAFPIANGQTARVSAIAAIAWIFCIVTVWALILTWLRRRLFDSAAGSETPAQVDAVGRRHILIRLGEASALITVAGAVVGALPRNRMPGKSNAASEPRPWSQTHPLPNADASVKPAPGTRPEFTSLENHYRIDINTVPPAIKEAGWKLHISGLVERTVDLTLADIRKFEPVHQFVTLACISNLVAGDLIGTTRWTGVSMQTILKEVRPQPGARFLKIRSADGFHEMVSMQTVTGDPRVMLAYQWDGVPLSAAHGFPLRIYIPDRYGMKQPKWIQSIEFIDRPEEGYWVKRGWDAEARMKATSVIDTMSSNMMISAENNQSLIPLGGIAHAGARGISRVQVQVDEQPWKDAQIRTPLSDLTWVVWRFDWPFQAGRHSFTVRCFEGNGTPQISDEASPHPSGATGFHRIERRI